MTMSEPDMRAKSRVAPITRSPMEPRRRFRPIDSLAQTRQDAGTRPARESGNAWFVNNEPMPN
jgi:hypothetical protein